MPFPFGSSQAAARNGPHLRGSTSAGNPTHPLSANEVTYDNVQHQNGGSATLGQFSFAEEPKADEGGTVFGMVTGAYGVAFGIGFGIISAILIFVIIIRTTLVSRRRKREARAEQRSMMLRDPLLAESGFDPNANKRQIEMRPSAFDENVLSGEEDDEGQWDDDAPDEKDRDRGMRGPRGSRVEDSPSRRDRGKRDPKSERDPRRTSLRPPSDDEEAAHRDKSGRRSSRHRAGSDEEERRHRRSSREEREGRRGSHRGDDDKHRRRSSRVDDGGEGERVDREGRESTNRPRANESTRRDMQDRRSEENKFDSEARPIVLPSAKRKTARIKKKSKQSLTPVVRR